MFLFQENERSKDLIIEHRFHKQIIGTKGEKIKEIRDRFNGVQVCTVYPACVFMLLVVYSYVTN